MSESRRLLAVTATLLTCAAVDGAARGGPLARALPRRLRARAGRRPHNSGHYTIDACITSQFEQQARVMERLPLGSTAMHCAAVMVNILGDSWHTGEPDWTKVLAHPRAKLHLYGKAEARPGRKMGHFTMLGDSVPAALAEALEIRAALVPGAGPIPS